MEFSEEFQCKSRQMILRFRSMLFRK